MRGFDLSSGDCIPFGELGNVGIVRFRAWRPMPSPDVPLLLQLRIHVSVEPLGEKIGCQARVKAIPCHQCFDLIYSGDGLL